MERCTAPKEQTDDGESLRQTDSYGTHLWRVFGYDGQATKGESYARRPILASACEKLSGLRTENIVEGEEKEHFFATCCIRCPFYFYESRAMLE